MPHARRGSTAQLRRPAASARTARGQVLRAAGGSDGRADAGRRRRRDWQFAWRAGAGAAAAAALAALGRLRAPRRIQGNEALVVSASLFFVAPAVMLLPLAGAGLSWMDALFEAVSGVTTTGLSTVRHVSARPAALLFARAWMQWYGGLGFLALAVALLTTPSVEARRLSLADSDRDNLVGSARVHFRRVLAAYVVLTAAGTGLLIALTVPPFAALLHALAAVSTGGFSSLDDSIAGLGGWGVRAAVTLISLTGAVSFTLYYRLLRRRWGELWRHPEPAALLVCALVAAGLLLLLDRLAGRGSWGGAVGNALAMAFSAQTTTGFATTGVGALPAPGCSGTAGWASSPWPWRC